MLAVVVTIVCHPDKIEEMIAALEGNAAHSRHEPGCLKWEWSQHIEDPAKFAIYELYTTREAFAAHKAWNSLRELGARWQACRRGSQGSSAR